MGNQTISINELIKLFEANKNSEKAAKMKAYLRNQFEFLGISKPIRVDLEKEFLNSYKEADMDTILDVSLELCNLKYREYMYTSQQLLLKRVKDLTIDDVDKMMNLTLINSWWENTDGYMAIIKKWLKYYPEHIESFVGKYYNKENFWLRRMAIIAQLTLKEQTNFSVLEKAIIYNFDDEEFFIQKAIGWALRDYSKYDKETVKNFIANNKDKMSKLSLREASKYL